MDVQHHYSTRKSGRPGWDEDLELWKSNPVECIKGLIGNPAFCNLVAYVPQQVFSDQAGQNCIFDEMWTADWWWDIQVWITSLRATQL